MHDGGEGGDCDPQLPTCPDGYELNSNGACVLKQSYTIKNNVKDSCLHAMTNTIINKNIEYETGVSMKSIFGANSKFNLTFRDTTLGSISGRPVDAQTNVVGTPIYYMLGNRKIYDSMDLEITLNSASMPGTSEEYIAVTILHETLHAYFRQTQQIDDHNEMVHNYIPWFKSALHALYPVIPPADLEALAYGGLMDSMAFTTSEKEVFMSSYNGINREYINGTKGTKCH